MSTALAPVPRYQPCPLAEPLGVGLHLGVPEAVYHADPCVEPSLSSTVARIVVNQSPAHAYLAHVRLGGKEKEKTPSLVLGGYVHGLMSGQLAEFALSPFDDYRSKDAKKWRDGILAAGQTPVGAGTAAQAEAIAKALRAKAAHGIDNSPFIETANREVTAIWQEQGEGWCRARYDVLDLNTHYADVWDWKTTPSVAPEDVARTIVSQGYDVQAAFYLRGLRHILPDYIGRMSFTFVFVETEPPYAVRRVCLSEGFLSLGSTVTSRAIAAWSQCLTTNVWPDHSGDTLHIEPPGWYAYKLAAQGIEVAA